MLLRLNDDEVTVKGRGCIYGRNNHICISKEETSLTTMSTEGLMLSCMVDATEGRDVASDDIIGYFLQTDYDKGDIHIKMEG